jgi:DNA-binding beta-propeller fold protein YncE
MKKLAIALAFASAACGIGDGGGIANAEVAVSIHDGKQPRLGQPAADVKPDTVVVIDLAGAAPKVVGTVQVPVSMIGPPTSVAVARDGSYAIVSAAQKLDPADATKFVLDNKVSVIDLADPKNPKVVQSLTAGDGASGIAINHAGTLALIASTGEGTVTVYSIANKRLTQVSKLMLSAQLGPVDANISPDGKTALITQRRGDAIWRLSIDGTKVTNTGITYPTGGQPYGSVFSHDGRYAYNSNLGGRPRPPLPSGAPRPPGPTIGTVTTIDLQTNKIVGTADVGPTPEHVTMSADGKYVAVTVVNGSSADPKSANYNDYGLLQVWRADGPKLTKVAEAHTGGWGQGAAWSNDGKTILQQGAISKVIQVFRFDGKTLKEDPAALLQFDTRPGAITTAMSR